MVIVNSEKIEYALTNTDLNKFLPDVKIYTYEELADTQNLKELLPDRRCAIIILAEQMPNIGHWVCIVKVERSFIFFDIVLNEVRKIFKVFWKFEIKII